MGNYSLLGELVLLCSTFMKSFELIISGTLDGILEIGPIEMEGICLQVSSISMA